MTSSQQAVIAFFEQVAQRDVAHLKMLQQDGRFQVEQGRWCFTLPDLYDFFRRQVDGFDELDYTQFRKLLFNSPVNPAIQPFCAEVTVVDNRGKVDQSTYGLIWHPAASQDGVPTQ